jgi:hypothetical protein
MGLQPYPVKKKIVEKLPRNSAGFCGGGQSLSWAVEPRKERKKERKKNCTSVLVAAGRIQQLAPFPPINSSTV